MYGTLTAALARIIITSLGESTYDQDQARMVFMKPAVTSSAPAHLKLATAVLVVGILVHQAYLARYHSPATRFGDETNLLFFSRYIARTGHWSMIQDEPGCDYIPPTYVSPDGIRYLTRYGPGKILIFLLAEKLGGETIIQWVNRIEGVIGVGAFYWFLLSFVHPLLAAAGAIHLLLLPPYTFFMVTSMTHPGSLVFILVSLLLLRSAGQGRAAMKLLWSGVFLGISTSYRYNNVVLWPLWVLALLWPQLGGPGQSSTRTLGWRLSKVAYLTSGLMLVLGCVAYYHWRQFGNPLTTGYALAGENQPFMVKYFKGNLAAVWGSYLLNTNGLTVSGLLGLFSLWRNRRRGLAFFLGIWSLIYPLLFSFYFGFGMAPSVYNGRFILPSLPPLILLTLFFFSDSLSNINRKPLAIALVGCIMGMQLAMLSNVFHPVLVIHKSASRLNEELLEELRVNLKRYPANSVFLGPPETISQLVMTFGHRFTGLPTPTSLPKAVIGVSSLALNEPGTQLKAQTARPTALRVNYSTVLKKAAQIDDGRWQFLITSESIAPVTVTANQRVYTYTLEWFGVSAANSLQIYRIGCTEVE